MMKKVRNMASDVMTILGGALWRPRPFLSRDRTTIMRVKLVHIMTIPGAMLRMPISTTPCTIRPVIDEPSAAPVSKVMLWATASETPSVAIAKNSDTIM